MTLKQIRDEMTEALASGALVNPEMFGSMLRPGDNPILRWRDAIDADISPIAPADVRVGDWVRVVTVKGTQTVREVESLSPAHAVLTGGWEVPRAWIKEVRRG